MLKQVIARALAESRAAWSACSPRTASMTTTSRSTRDESRTRVLTRLHFLRQQKGKPAGQPHDALADFIAPKASGRRDYIGAFAVTAGIGIEPHLERFAQAHDDYSSIMLKALADRLAEAFAERLHERVRREFWGYAPEERLTNEQLIREGYRGIRPAPGYPACPDHTEKATLWKLLDAERQRRHPAHRVLRDVSHRRGQRLVLRASRLAVLRGRQDRPATRCRTTPRARRSGWRRRSAGCRRISATTPDSDADAA